MRDFHDLDRVEAGGERSRPTRRRRGGTRRSRRTSRGGRRRSGSGPRTASPGSSGQSTRTRSSPSRNDVPARTTRTGTPRPPAAASAASLSGPVAARAGSSSSATSSLRMTSAAPPTWSRCGCVRTSAVSQRMPIARSCPATSASGGPSSTRILASRVSRSTESPCPTSRNVTRSPTGRIHAGAGRAATQTTAITASDPGREGELADSSRRHATHPLDREPARGEPDRDAERRASPDPCTRQAATTRATNSSQAAAQPASSREACRRAGRDRIGDRREEAERRARAGRPRTPRRSRGPCRAGACPKWKRTIGAVASPHARRPPMHPQRLAVPESRPTTCEHAGRATKIAATAANESWKPGSSTAVGIHARSTSAPTARKCQRSRGRAVSQASDASAPATPARDHRRLPPNREDVRRDHAHVTSSRATRESRSSQPSPRTRRGEECDVLPGDGEEVVEARGTEVVVHVGRQPLVLAEHDAEDDARGERRSSRASLRARPGRATGRRDRRSHRGARPAASSTPRARHGCPGARATPVRRSRRAGRGSTTRTVASKMAPRGGERPTGSTRSTRSRSRVRGTPASSARTRVDQERNGRARPSPTRRRPSRRAHSQHALAESLHPKRSPPEPDDRQRDRRCDEPRRPIERAQGDHRNERGDDHRGERHRDPDRERGPARRRADEECGPVALDDAASRGHEIAQLLDARRADAGYRIEVVHRGEGAVLCPVVEDLLRGDRADTGELVELFGRRRREAHRDRPSSATRASVGSARRRSRSPRPRPAREPGHRRRAVRRG